MTVAVSVKSVPKHTAFNHEALARPGYDTTAYLPAARQRLPLSLAARRQLLGLLIALGVVCSAFYFSWWLEAERLASPVLAGAFALALAYVAVQVYAPWYVYASIAPAAAQRPPAGLSVDVLVPVFDEPFDLIEQTLRAALAIRYPHRTYLLDDARDPRFARLAEALGAGYLTRSDGDHAKAGNINAALTQTDGELVAVFDVDHVPSPDFLDAVLGAFADPAVAFVQSAVAFHNAGDSLVARASAEQAYDVYGPTSMGMHGCQAAPVWGSHTTFRRAALADIGGYQPGLAEDLHTSIRLHAAGWRSVYLAGVHAAGLVPSDLRAFITQQRKWARGVFGMLIEVYPRLWRRLTGPQRAAYSVRATYYLIGPVFAAHALLGVYVLLFGTAADIDGFADYLLHAAPLVAMILAIRTVANLLWNVQAEAVGLKWRGYVLACALWPVYTGALVRAVLGRPLPHVATPKRRTVDAHPRLVIAQLALIALLAAGVVARLGDPLGVAMEVALLFAVAAIAIQGYAVAAAMRP